MTSLPTSENPRPVSKQTQRNLILTAGRRGWTPPPRLSLPGWADRYRQLARSAGSLTGQWHTSKVEIARGPMLAVTEPGVHVITAMVCTQLMKTALLENIFGYHAHLDPCPILLLQPKDDAAEQFSKERLTPLIRATPILRELLGPARTRNADDTLLYKSFPGGFIALAGAGSPDNLARRPIRILLADEIDKYPVTREGDPITLAEERTATFATWLSVRACSPTIAEESRIEDSYEASDQRRASVSCPHCGHRLFPDFFRHVEWDKTHDTAGNVSGHDTETACIYCEACGRSWSEADRLKALALARWHQTRPFECCGVRHVPLDDYTKAWRVQDGATAIDAVWDWWADAHAGRYAVYRAKCSVCGRWGVDNTHAGFQASKLFSPWTRDRPPAVAAKWIAAQGDEEKLQAWWNTQMGLPYRAHTGRRVQTETLLARGELWPADVADGVAVVTVGIDVQDYRVECETVGWGRNEESWSIDYSILEGEFSDVPVVDQVDDYLKRIWARADGRPFEVMAVCIDSGGHHTQGVYEFCKARLGRHVWAIKGESARGGERNPVWPPKRPSARSKKTFRPVILGVNAAKDTIRQRLLLATPGPGYMHFPADRDIGYYTQLTAERLMVREAGGKRYRVWELPAGRANEALDCRVYAYGALCGLLYFGLQLNRRADAVGAVATVLAAPARTAGGNAAGKAAPESGEIIAPGAVRPVIPKSFVHRLA